MGVYFSMWKSSELQNQQNSKMTKWQKGSNTRKIAVETIEICENTTKNINRNFQMRKDLSLYFKTVIVEKIKL